MYDENNPPPDGWNYDGETARAAITGVDDHTDSQGVFSWDVAEHHLFQVVREPRRRAKPGEPHPGFEWVCRATIARFYGAAAPVLLESCILALKYEGWAWVEPE